MTWSSTCHPCSDNEFTVCFSVYTGRVYAMTPDVSNQLIMHTKYSVFCEVFRYKTLYQMYKVIDIRHYIKCIKYK